MLKGNPYLKIGLVIILVVLMAIFIFGGSPGEVTSDDGDGTEDRNLTGGESRVPNEQIRMLGSQVDTIADQVVAAQNRSQVVESELQQITNMLIELRKHEEVNTPDAEFEQRLVSQLSAMIDQRIEDSLIRSIDEGTIDPGNAPSANDALNGRRAERESTFEREFVINNQPSGQRRPSSVSNRNVDESINWVTPVGFDSENESVMDTLSSLNPFSRSQSSSIHTRATGTDSVEEPDDEPYVTIPPDSWMFDAVALTALVGRVPRDGISMASWDFNLVLGRDISIANGHNLPEIEDARASGIAVGQRAERCIRGYVTSLTFVFADGRVFHTTGGIEDPIAMIGDEYGNPCVPGTYFGNTKQLLAAHGTVSGIQSIARSIEQRQQTIDSTATSQSLRLTGSGGQAALGAFGVGSTNRLGELIAEEAESFYPFVYAPPGETVSLRFSRSVDVDYSHNNRRVRYEDTVDYVLP